MAHPKRKISKQRRDKRRTHYKATAETFIVCSNCGASILYHRVCGECGYYKGKQVVDKTTTV